MNSIPIHQEAYFHEDDYCQTEILPLSNWAHCISQIGEIESFSEKHKVPGAGWDKMYVREEEPQPLSNLGIKKAQFINHFSKHHPQHSKVYTGYSLYREICKNAIAFEISEYVNLFCDFDDHNIVNHIWFIDNGDIENESLRNMVQSFTEFGHQYQLLLVDWSWGALIPLKSKENLTAYICRLKD